LNTSQIFITVTVADPAQIQFLCDFIGFTAAECAQYTLDQLQAIHTRS